LLALALAGLGGLVFWRHRSGRASAEQGYEEIRREDYERWMQDLGYTE
jgi:hypothetical protein